MIVERGAPGAVALDLVPARFLRRYRRFLADVELDGREVTVHVPNTGSMATLNTPGMTAWLAKAANPDRKLAWTLVLIGTPGGGLAVIDTGLPNRLAHAAVAAGIVPELAGYAVVRREVRYGVNSRADLHLTGHPTRSDAWVEVKNTTMLGAPGRADFPDAVTERGRKHLHELAAVARAGGRAVQWFLVDRTDCDACGIAGAIDPAYAQALREAAAAGVEIIAWRADLSPTAARLARAVPVAMP